MYMSSARVEEASTAQARLEAETGSDDAHLELRHLDKAEARHRATVRRYEQADCQLAWLDTEDDPDPFKAAREPRFFGREEG